MSIVPIDGGVCASLGFESSAVCAGIKSPESSRLDCALVVSREKAVVGGMFTTNRIKAAPVLWSKRVCEKGVAQAIFVNSGNANACTGDKGLKDVEDTAKEVARLLKISEEEVLVLSTGVIGVPLPMDRIIKGVNECVKWLSPENHLKSAQAIMTTDTVPKEYAVAVQTSKGIVRIGGMAKGAGMICPNMATMLCVLTTDAKISKSTLQTILSSSVSETFNCIAVDNDMSTNDSVVILANGMSGIDIDVEEKDIEVFSRGLHLVCERLAKSIVKDGEGATKFVEIEVVGAMSKEEAKQVAKSVAVSQLCKTAFFGADPNWGRIVCAVGYSGIPVRSEKISLWIGEIKVFEGGVPTAYDEKLVVEKMKNREFKIKVDLGMGDEKAIFWTSDLSYDYVKINADYRT